MKESNWTANSLNAKDININLPSNNGMTELFHIYVLFLYTQFCFDHDILTLTIKGVFEKWIYDKEFDFF